MKRKPFWKSRILYVLQFVVGLAALAAGGLKVGSLDLVIDQLDVIGPRAWLGIVAGSLSSGLSWTGGGPSIGLVLLQEHDRARSAANDNVRADRVANAS